MYNISWQPLYTNQIQRNELLLILLSMKSNLRPFKTFISVQADQSFHTKAISLWIWLCVYRGMLEQEGALNKLLPES